MNTTKLPTNYEVDSKYDLKNNKKMKQWIQIVSIIVIAGMIFIAKYFDLPMRPDWNVVVTIIVTLLFCIIYIFTHELIHGVFIKHFSGVKPNYYIRLPFVSTGSDKAYFNIKSFIWIALAPVVIWGVVLTILLFNVPSNFFLSIYIVQIINLAGASGDFLQTYVISKLPEGALIQDSGKETTIYVPKR